jgi:cobalt-zinc-cadmium efflux system protein
MAEHAGHVGHAHTHVVAPTADRRRVVFALCLILGFMLLEVVLGVVANSLALLSDAGHMLTDALALAMSLMVLRLAVRRPSGALTYGLRRTEILSGLANGITLLVIAAVVAVEGIQRLVSPPVVEARLVLPVALAGIGVSLLATWQLARAQRQSLNIRGSLQHLVTDLYGFAGTALAAVIILLTGFMRADALASLVVAAVMARTGWKLVREAGAVLLEAAPGDLDADQVASTLRAHPQVVNVHDFHLWEITSGMPALSAHVLVAPGEDCHEVRRELEHTLQHDFHVTHTTLQVDHAAGAEQVITPLRRPHAT